MRRWLRDSSGASALEFALLAPVMLMLLLGTVEIGWMFAQDASQDAAAMRLARDLKVGFVDDVRINATSARQRMCEVALLIDCDNLEMSTASAVTLTPGNLDPAPLDDDGRLADTSFTPGDSDLFMIVTLSRRHRFFTPLIGALMQDGDVSTPFTLPRTSRIMIRTEPW